MAGQDGKVKSKSLKGNLTSVSNKERIRTVITKKPKDVIIFVPGTMDPVNSDSGSGAKNSESRKKSANKANRTYWASDEQFYEIIKRYETVYNNLVVVDFFSWSGDNSKKERDAAGLKLKKLLDRYYTTSEKLSYHFISHSHGGNVIIECLNQMAKDTNFPDNIKIKSISFLSTPFFKKLHRIDDACYKFFAPDCEIINVTNHYDLTQQVIADFTMNQVPELDVIVKRNKSLLDNISKLNKLEFKPLSHLTDWWLSTQETTDILNLFINGSELIQEIIDDIIVTIKAINSEHPKFIDDILRGHLISLLSDIKQTLDKPILKFKELLPLAAISDRGGVLYHVTYLHNFIKRVNDLIAFDKKKFNSELIDIIDSILMNQMDYYDNTVTSPKGLISSKYKIIPVDITKYDPYVFHARRKLENFDTFIGNLSKIEKKYEALNNENRNPKTVDAKSTRFELLFNLIAQLDHKSVDIPKIIGKLDTLEYVLLGGKFETGIENLQKHLKNYNDLLLELDCDCNTEAGANTRIIKKDKFGEEVKVEGKTQYVKKSMLEQHGSLAYFAVKSHGLSHTQLFDEVDKALRDTFESSLKSSSGRVSNQTLVLHGKVKQAKRRHKEQKEKDAITAQKEKAARDKRDNVKGASGSW